MQERDRLFGKQFSILPMRLDQCDSLTVISLPEVVRRTGKSRSSIYSDIQKGRFPRAVRLGLRSKGWIDAEVDLWVFERMRERNQSPRRQIRTVPVRLDRTYPTIHHSHDADVGK
jgi:prophage regulatory protein